MSSGLHKVEVPADSKTMILIWVAKEKDIYIYRPLYLALAVLSALRSRQVFCPFDHPHLANVGINKMVCSFSSSITTYHRYRQGRQNFRWHNFH
jgi:hypothetical protein